MSDLYTDPPGGIPVPTVPESIRQRWIDTLTQFWRDGPTRSASRVGPSASMPADAQPVTSAITWSAFPAQATGKSRYAKAEELGYEDIIAAQSEVLLEGESAPPEVFDGRQNQDEYLEWRAVPSRERSGIAGVEMTCEPPDVWEAWFEADKTSCAQAYSDLLGVAIKAADLRAPSGLKVGGLTLKYNPRNRFNTRDGIVHLTQEANTLGAEVNLAQDAGRNWRRGVATELFSDKTELCDWTGIGAPGRSSDPNIAIAVYTNTIVSSPGSVGTLTGPVGLYIVHWDSSGRVTLGGQPVGPEWWIAGHGMTRPTSPIVLTDPAGQTTTFERVVRLRFAPPPGTLHSGRPALVSDCEIDGEPVHHGGQIVELVTMGLFVDTWALRAGAPLPPPIVRRDPRHERLAVAPPAKPLFQHR